MEYVAIHFHSAGAVIVIYARGTVHLCQMVQVAIAHHIAQFGGVAAVVDGTLVINLRADIVYIAVFDHMVVAMKQYRHARSVIDIALGHTVSHAVNPHTGFIRLLYAVEVVNPAILNIIACRCQ